jgi:acyl dehydratase
MTVHYLEDFEVGQIIETDRLTVTESMIIDFAQEFDPQPFHTDAAAARNSMFRGLAASGWHICAITMGMVVRSGLKIANGHVGMGIDSIRWPRSVRPGDSLRVTIEILEIRPSQSQPGWGVVKVRWITLNQDGETVAEILPNYWVQARHVER